MEKVSKQRMEDGTWSIFSANSWSNTEKNLGYLGFQEEA